MRVRSGKIRLGGTILLLLVLGAIGFLGIFAPYWWDYYVIKEIGRSAALKWNETERLEKAKAKVDEELRRREVPDYFSADFCRFEEEQSIRRVVCSWQVDVYYPMTDYFKTLSFTTTSELDRTGNVETW